MTLSNIRNRHAGKLLAAILLLAIGLVVRVQVVEAQEVEEAKILYSLQGRYIEVELQLSEKAIAAAKKEVEAVNAQWESTEANRPLEFAAVLDFLDPPVLIPPLAYVTLEQGRNLRNSEGNIIGDGLSDSVSLNLLVWNRDTNDIELLFVSHGETNKDLIDYWWREDDGWLRSVPEEYKSDILLKSHRNLNITRYKSYNHRSTRLNNVEVVKNRWKVCWPEGRVKLWIQFLRRDPIYTPEEYFGCEFEMAMTQPELRPVLLRASKVPETPLTFHFRGTQYILKTAGQRDCEDDILCLNLNIYMQEENLNAIFGDRKNQIISVSEGDHEWQFRSPPPEQTEE